MSAVGINYRGYVPNSDAVNSYTVKIKVTDTSSGQVHTMAISLSYSLVVNPDCLRQNIP